MSWCTPLAANSVSAVHDPRDAMNEFAKEEPPEGFVICTASDLASFRRAHDSSADPKLLAADDRAARAVRKAFAVERSSEYAA